ncbi:hypothetical protein CIB84_009498 [Bambusicola thoracicus]|uniref:Uncharacterized protein n=1 Tax=Bambusicola thoracicus TaxID=9083 RepID=A0A2P4SRM6_BAMTH|nr:hypothetical protein CIB84_009498 [Bambusicola thoracicus]
MAASMLALILPSSKAPMSPSFPFPSLVLSQVLSSLLHQVLRKRAGQGLPFLELLCRGSGMSLVEGLRTLQVQGSCKFTLSQEGEPKLRAIPQAHMETLFSGNPSLHSQGSHELILHVPLPHACPGGEKG